MNPRRGITATSAEVRRRRWSGEARRKSPQVRRSARIVPPWAASAQARAKILTVEPLSLQPHQLCMVVKSCLSVKVEPPRGGCFANLDRQPFFTWASCVGLR